jgi:hypothetical protein
VVTADDVGCVYFWADAGAERGLLLGVYLAAYPILAIYWKDHQHLLLADTGGPRNMPNIYRLKLEGM